ncbi:hypothetical protein [Calderihabitans maritimus]|uniref:Uncharacterized protein n=1 Tax=Calderihabitans maritimus TaxID=1246530 RepID=A0A1Z5HR78_9FIRM|nr:hypothetical protein [Calderihabitans maritimus]GAW91938.1 hypothetical protein KKC1_10980 [Calderihabitans maritimus]
MKKALILLVLGALLFGIAPAVFAHGGEIGKVDARTYVRQAIAFLEGTENIEAAEGRIEAALELPSHEVNKELLKKAQEALNNSNLEEAKLFLVKALGEEPDGAEVLSLHAKFNGNLIDYVMLFLAGLFILTGGVIISRKTPAVGEKGGAFHG